MTKIAFNVTDANGNPEEGALIDIQLPAAGISEAGTVLPTSLKIKTNAQGKVDNAFGYVELEPVETIEYVIVITGANKKSKGIFKCLVPDTTEIVKAEDLFHLPPPSGLSYDAAAIADITNERILTQQAAESADATDAPRYKSIDAQFFSDAGNYVYPLTLGQENGFFTINETTLSATRTGNVIIPDDLTTNFEVGTSFLFIRGNDNYAATTIDISFGGATANVLVEALDVAGTKLQSRTDVISLIKVADNSWKIFNLSQGSSESGGEGGGVTQSTFFTIFQNINDIEAKISNILTAQVSYVEALNLHEKELGDQSASIISLNAAVASLNAIIAALNATIDRKITEAVPGLGDLNTYVDEAEAARDISITSAISSGQSSESSTSSAQSALASATLSTNNLTAITEALGASSIYVKDLQELKDLPYDIIQSAFREGISLPNDPRGTAQRYYFDETSLLPSDPDFLLGDTSTYSQSVVRPDYIPIPTIANPSPIGIPDDSYPGRWIAMPIELEELAKIDNGVDGNNTHRFLMTPAETGVHTPEVVDRAAVKTALRINATNKPETTDVTGLGALAFATAFPAPPPQMVERIASGGGVSNNNNGLYLPTIFQDQSIDMDTYAEFELICAGRYNGTGTEWSTYIQFYDGAWGDRIDLGGTTYHMDHCKIVFRGHKENYEPNPAGRPDNYLMQVHSQISGRNQSRYNYLQTSGHVRVIRGFRLISYGAFIFQPASLKPFGVKRWTLNGTRW